MAETNLSTGRTGAEKQQQVCLKNRAVLSLDGVLDVSSFDEMTVILKTVLGMLEIGGTGLHILSFDAKSGEAVLEGQISALIYQEQQEKKRLLFGRGK